MHTTIHRIGALTAMLVFAAGTSALAAVTVEPSTSIELVAYPNGDDSSRWKATITATSYSGPISMPANSCHALLKVLSQKSGQRMSSENGRREEEHFVTLKLESTREAGSCRMTFSDGSHPVTVHIRVEKS